MTRVLVLQSGEHEGIVGSASGAACAILKDNGLSFEVVSVRRFQSLACAASMSLEVCDYDGIVVLGCLVIDGDAEFLTTFYRETARCFADIAVHYVVPIGFGLRIFSDVGAAEQNIMQCSTEAAENCVDLIKLKDQLGYAVYESFTKYSN